MNSVHPASSFGTVSRLLVRFSRTLLVAGALLLPLLAIAAGSAAAPAVPLAGQRVLVLGDSITQDGRYVSFLEYYLRRLSPAVTCDLVSVGLSSETVSGLSEKSHPYPRPCVLTRLDRALQAVKPTVVFACYGMNDGIYHPPSPERLAAFTAGLRQLIAAVRATGAPLILITPPVFDPVPIKARLAPLVAAGAADSTDYGYGAPYARYDEVLAEFARVEVALHAPGVTVIDLHTAMAAALAARRASEPAFSFAPDGVHPGDAGHALIARTLLAALGYPLPADALGADPTALRATPLFAVVDLRRQLRSEAWLPFIGYERGGAFKSASVAAAESAATRLLAEADALAAR